MTSSESNTNTETGISINHKAAPTAFGEEKPGDLSLIPIIRLSPYHIIQQAEAFSPSKVDDTSDDSSVSISDEEEDLASKQIVEVSEAFVVSDEAAPLLHLNPIKRRRAAFLSATVFKTSQDEKLGLKFSRMGGKMKITSVKTDGLMAKAPFKAGDILVSVNNKNCKDLSLSKLQTLLKSITGTLTIVVENKFGDSKLVESMVVKPSQDSKTGMGVASSRDSRYTHIASVHPQRLFAESLLNRKDYILSINGISCDYLNSATVADIVCRAAKCVTVVAERRLENGIVVAMAA